jgi:hypothetical protein
VDRSQLYNDSEEALRQVLDGRQATIWTAMPGIVQKVDLGAMTCEVQISIKGQVIDENNNVRFVEIKPLLDVPIVFPSAGGFTITLPLKSGDEVLVVFASRCIDAWWQNGNIQQPMRSRMHDLSDGFAIPGPKSQPKKISGISSTGAQIRNDDGTTYIEIAADGKIKLVSPSEVDITGNLKVTGNITSTLGDIVASVGDVKAGVAPISLTNHRHTSTTPGNPTGPPLP